MLNKGLYYILRNYVKLNQLNPVKKDKNNI